MSKAKKITLIIAAVVILALLVVAGVTDAANGTVACPDCDGTVADCETCGGEANVRGTLWALLPPVIAIGLALITKEVYSSLLIGILSGALLYSDFSFTGTLDAVINDGLISAVAGSAGIFIFLVELGIIVALINKAGGSASFGNWAKTHIKTRAGAMLATFVLGVLIFVDDYFNCLTVGSVMRPVTDSKRISRAKLAYLIDATAAPICMIAPISSWAAAVASYAEEGQGLKLFIAAIPYNFYSILTLVFIIALALMGFDYGSMRIHELNAIENNDLYTCGNKNESAEVIPSSKGKVIDLVLPIVFLIVSCVFALVYVGGILDGASFVDSFANTDATVGLPWGGLIALVLIIVYMLCRRLISFKESMDCVPQGFIAMVPAILILTFATALKNMTTILGAKYFVGNVMSGQAAALGSFLPAIIFLVACVLAFATGTSWGTFGILIPIVTAIFPADSTLLIIGMSACLAGAVCGDHCSPISDTTIMSSAGGQCNHINHVSTQMPYAVTVAAISFVMFLISGFVQNIWICLPLGIVLTVATLFVIKLVTKKAYSK
ncbi:MAG: Na+/H+ antiporter NhaC family protein [Ruminococcaceae bacterium]|nr:Na+/H+ antiporter NhaC family protein [Oscillospiraceae bacterium]